MLSMRWNRCRICSVCDEIRSAYAQCAINLFRVCSSWFVHVKTVHILLLAEHARKFVPRMLGVWWNRFCVCSCDKIVSADAQHTHAIIFKKYLIKMQILTINNQNCQKPSRNPSNRTKVKILRKKIFLDSLSKKFVSTYAQSPNIEILAKIEGKEANFFSKIYEGHIRIWFRSEKIQNYLMLVYL
jgi:hypothetical protein